MIAPGMHHAPLPASAAGMALLLCLLFLTALTLLGLSAAGETVIQGKLTGNLQESERARQNALVAQDWVEAWFLGLGETAPGTCSQPCAGLMIHPAGSLPPGPETLDQSWWRANGHEAGLDPFTQQRLAILAVDSAAPSLWVIEHMHEEQRAGVNGPATQAWYRILTRGSGRTGTGVAVVESIVTRPWRGVATPGLVLQGSCPGFDASHECKRLTWRRLR